MRSAVRLNAEIRPYFERLEEVCLTATPRKVLAALRTVYPTALFAGTTGCGYDDYSLAATHLDKICRRYFFGTEAALVRIGCGNTHALSAMFSAVKTGDTIAVRHRTGV